MSSPDYATEGRLRRAAAEPAAQRPPGLVHFSTSDPIRLDQDGLRKKRTRKATITAARLLQEQVTNGGRRTYEDREGSKCCCLHSEIHLQRFSESRFP